MVRAVVALLLTLSVLTGAVAPVAGSTPPATSTAATVDAGDAGDDGRNALVSTDAAAATDSLAQTTTFHLTPTRPGEVLVTLDYDVPSRVVDVETRVPSNATVVSTDGFDPSTGDRYTWTESTDEPSLTYRLAVNETTAGRLPLASDGTMLFADTGPWALFRRPSTGTRWTWHGSEVELTQSTAVDGDGVVGEQLVFLGEYTDHRRDANGQRFRLVVPDAAELAVEPSAILDSYADASGRLRVGDRDDRVLVIAAPTDGVEWGVRGLHTGESDIWVQASEPLATPNNVWLHEYVHSRQSYQPTREVRWVTEGSATYYAALFSLQQGHIGYDEFASWLAVGSRPPYAETVLSTPSTWGRQGHYHKGGLVVGSLDYRIRAASDGDASFETVFTEMNDHEGTLTAEAFWTFVADAGNGSVATDGEAYATTTDAPSTWTRAEHVEAFGSFPAHFDTRFSISESTPTRVSGPYRTTTDTELGGIVLVTNETLELPVRVTNDGGAPGQYDVVVRTDENDTIEQFTGRLDSGESTTETLTRTFETPGTYVLSVDGEEFTVFVRSPAQLSVTSLSATPVRVAQGDPIAVTATVENGESRPGVRTVEFTLDGEVVAREEVVLDAGEETTVSATVTPTTTGTHRLGAGGSTTVLVDVVPAKAAGTATESSDEQTSTTTPGFGPLVTLCALVVVGVLAVCGRRAAKTRE
ncbi:CARDB domain-containing protein [Halogranum rubrum]|uniref:CARDB domain-containing protein n=1 Tax=Halogranum salarium B-1 TaxID=1210908 RepID=J2ZZ76_9EURY|nr:CARDB domain-containing protein [Halogranum salarium]EJN58333.1 hypothetical protein HSB1_37500 [Halogranum salarium B-1]